MSSTFSPPPFLSSSSQPVRFESDRIQGGPTSHSLGVLFREIFIHIVTIAGTLGRLELDGSFRLLSSFSSSLAFLLLLTSTSVSLTAESSFTLLLEQPSPSPAAPDSHTLLTDSASLQRQRQLYDAFVPAPDSFSSEGIRTAHAEGGEGEEDVKVKWLKEITTGVLDVSPSLSRASSRPVFFSSLLGQLENSEADSLPFSSRRWKSSCSSFQEGRA